MKNNKTYSSVFRLKKLKTDAQILGASEHNLRTKQPRNADRKRTVKNEVIIGKGQNILSLVKERISGCKIKVRKNAVRALEIIQSAGRQFFKNIRSRDEWIQDSIGLLRKEFGKKNLVHVVLHHDETTLHLHSVVVPIVPAKDQNGKVYKNHKSRKLKLDAKGLLEQLAHERRSGKEDRAAAKFRLSDINEPAKFIHYLMSQDEPGPKFLKSKLTQETIAFLSSDHRVLEKHKLLVAELNKILAGPALLNQSVPSDLALSSNVQHLKDQNPKGDDLYILHRLFLTDIFSTKIKPIEPRPIGSPTAPYMHHLQVAYYNLCKKLDSEIAEPRYHTKINHSELAEFNSLISNSLKKIADFPDIKIPLPSPNEVNPKDIGKYIVRLNQQIEEQLRPVKATVAAAIYSNFELEKSKNSIGILNQGHKNVEESLRSEINELRSQNDDLKAKNDELLNQLRGIPLLDVMQKLRFAQPVENTKNEFRLPDNRVIAINEQSFKEINGRCGLGSMAKRKSAKGAIDLVMFVTGWELPDTLRWLKTNFDMQMTRASLIAQAQYVAENELQNTISEDQLEIIADPAAIYHRPDAAKWPLLRDQLLAKFKLPAAPLDELHQANIIHANQFGCLVCCQNGKQGTLATAFVHSLESKTSPELTCTVEILPGPNPFTIGDSAATEVVMVETPFAAMEYYATTHQGKCQIIATKSFSPQTLVSILQPQTSQTKKSIVLAYAPSKKSQDEANNLRNILQQAGFHLVNRSTSPDSTKSKMIHNKPSPNNKPDQECNIIWRKNDLHWQRLLIKLTTEFHLDVGLLQKLHEGNVIGALANGILAVGRRKLLSADSKICGITMQNLNDLYEPLQVQNKSAGGAFFVGKNFDETNLITLATNPLEALSYRQYLDQSGDLNTHIISIDAELPSNELVKKIMEAEKTLVNATNSFTTEATLLNAVPCLRQPDGKAYPKLEFRSAQVPDFTINDPDHDYESARDTGGGNVYCNAWNQKLAEELKSNRRREKESNEYRH